MLASIDLDGVRLWDLAAPTADVAHLPTGFGEGVGFHPDGGSLLTFSTAGMHRWRITPGPRDPASTLQIGPPQPLDVPANPFAQKFDRDRDGQHVAAIDRARNEAVVLRSTGRRTASVSGRTQTWLPSA